MQQYHLLALTFWFTVARNRLAAEGSSPCELTNATEVKLSGSMKVNVQGNKSGHYYFLSTSEDLAVAVTPGKRLSDPAISLYGYLPSSLQGGRSLPGLPDEGPGASVPQNVHQNCSHLVSAQDYGGNYIVIPGKRRKNLTAINQIELLLRENDPDPLKLGLDNYILSQGGADATLKKLIGQYGDPPKTCSLTGCVWQFYRYHLHVKCPQNSCEYNVSIGVGSSYFEKEEIKDGETKSGVLYPGIQYHFYYDCDKECAASADGVKKRLTFSAWPRDATSDELELLVQKGRRPMTADGHHLPKTKGWFGGRVVSCQAEKSRYYITVMKKFRSGVLPFVLTVTLPQTLQELPLGRPIFGAINAKSMAYYRFEVKQPNTDIEVYLTSISGDADLVLSHSSVHRYPRLGSAQWSSSRVGDDELVVKPDDRQRMEHPTGWFHIGVRAERSSAFSLIALAETTQVAGVQQQVITWTELYLGLPQALSVSQHRPTYFLFYSQLHSANMYLHFQSLKGELPDLCMQSCGDDPHMCPYISPLQGEAAEGGGVSQCTAVRLEALSSKSGSSLAPLSNPCSSCWYSILVTSKVPTKSQFRITLSADGVAQPLVAGESFKGYVDKNDVSVTLVYYLSRETLRAHVRSVVSVSKGKASIVRRNATLRMVLTPVFGDPHFSIRKGSPQDGEVLFNSLKSARNDYELKLTQKTGQKFVGAYYVTVWAATMHSQFRMQVFYENPLESGSLPTAGSIDGLPQLQDGRMVRGALVNGQPDVYLFQPRSTLDAPDITVTVAALGPDACDVAAVVVKQDMKSQAILDALLQRGDPMHKEPESEYPRIYSCEVGMGDGNTAFREVEVSNEPNGQELCEHDCDNFQKCVGFDFSQPGTCRLYEVKKVLALPEDGSIKRKYCSGRLPRRYRCRDGQAEQNAALVQYSSSTQDECAAMCNRSESCVAFDYSVSGKPDSCRLYEQDRSNTDPGEDARKYCSSEDMHGLPGEGLVAWFQSRNADVKWPSSIGDFVAHSLTGNVEVLDEAGNGAAKPVKYLKGTATSEYDFGDVLAESFTLCSISRYAGAKQERIFAGSSSNFAHGHWKGKLGMAYYDTWMTDNTRDQGGSKLQKTDWLVMCGTNKEQLVFVNGANVATLTSGRGGGQSLLINNGAAVDSTEQSDWGVMEVATWNRALSAAEMRQASVYFMQKLMADYTEYPKGSCLGARGYLLRDVPGSADDCQNKCRDMGSFCSGYNMMNGKCTFLSGRIDEPTPGDDTCFKRVVSLKMKDLDQGQIVWKTLPGEQLLTIRHTDPAYRRPADGLSWAIAVLPSAAGVHDRLEYQIEAFSSNNLVDLPVTGVPIAGQVSAGEYRRFRLVLTVSRRNLAVSLIVLSGDASLYLDTSEDVSKTVFKKSSELVGSDSIFVSAWGDLNAHCNLEERSQKECVYYVAVYGSSGICDFRISATSSIGMPLLLGPGLRLPVVLMKGEHQYFHFRVKETYGVTVQFIISSGTIGKAFAKLTDAASAEQRYKSSSKVINDMLMGRIPADISGTHFAGVWTLRFSVDRMQELCRKYSSTPSGCAAFIVVEAKQALVAKVVMIEDAHPAFPPAPGATPAPTPPPVDVAVQLEAGMPARAELKARRENLFSFDAHDLTDIAVSVTPLSSCRPFLKVTFPSHGHRTCSKRFWPFRLGYISARIRAKHPCFKTGVFLFAVRVMGSLPCQVDIRAQYISRTHATQQVITLMLDSPVLISENRTRALLFTSRISSKAQASERDRLTIRVTSLTNDIDVKALFLTPSSFQQGTSKNDRLKQLLSQMTTYTPQRREGMPAVFSIHNFAQHCNDELLCQIIVRIESAKAGRYFDAFAVATDDVNRRFGADILMPDIPVTGKIDTSKSPAVEQYQIFVNNPEASLKIRLSCTGSNAKEACSKLRFSADARMEMSKLPFSSRAYQGKSPTGLDDGLLEIVVDKNSAVRTPASAAGACQVPCVLTVRVETTVSESEQVEFLVVAAETRGYTLLLDGNDPVHSSAATNEPVYFIFDSRRKSPLLTVVLSMPHSGTDPFGELVSMWGLTCDVRTEGINKKRPPSRHNFHFQGYPNPRNQIVALVTHSVTSLHEHSPTTSENRDYDHSPFAGDDDTDNHCYYRIAVASHRVNPISFSIRAFDWHEESSLPMGEPLNGIVDDIHAFSYYLEAPEAQSDVVLSLEVCHGEVRLETSDKPLRLAGALPAHEADGGFDEQRLPAKYSQWLRLSSKSVGGYILTAEDPAKRRWLAPPNNNKLLAVEEGGDSGSSVRIFWEPSLLFGTGLSADGEGDESHPSAWYEVFYLMDDTESIFNISTPCGLYEAARKSIAKRKFVKTETFVEIHDLAPGRNYIFNVVARNYSTGSSIAYTPFRSFAPSSTDPDQYGEGGGESWWFDSAPMFVIFGVLACCCCWTRPWCKSGSGFMAFDMELPRYSGGSSAREYSQIRSNAGSYAPPSVVGGR